MILKLTKNAEQQLELLKKDPSQHRILKDVSKTLKFMSQNLRHPSLCTHEFEGIVGPNGEKVFEAYAQQKTSSAYKIIINVSLVTLVFSDKYTN